MVMQHGLISGAGMHQCILHAEALFLDPLTSSGNSRKFWKLRQTLERGCGDDDISTEGFTHTIGGCDIFVTGQVVECPLSMKARLANGIVVDNSNFSLLRGRFD